MKSASYTSDACQPSVAERDCAPVFNESRIGQIGRPVKPVVENQSVIIDNTCRHGICRDDVRVRTVALVPDTLSDTIPATGNNYRTSP